MIDQLLGARDKGSGRRQRGMNIECCLIAPARIQKEQSWIAHRAIDLDEETAGLCARACRRLAKLGCNRAVLALDGVKSREDDEFVRHVETLGGGAASAIRNAGTVGWARTTDLLFHRQAL